MELFSVLITGANRGIGLEFTRQLVNSNRPPKHVFATYRNEATVQALHSTQTAAPPETNVHLLKMDVLKPSEVEAARKVIAETVGENGLTLLINNAGVSRRLSFPEVTEENLMYHFRVNTVGPILLAQAILPLLKKAASRNTPPGMSFSRAAILNISSLYGSIGSTGILCERDVLSPSYKISKAALNMAMHIMATATKDDKVLIVNMCPGWVKTDMSSPEAELLPQDSITAMLETLASLNETHHGTFMDRFGKAYPW